MIPHNICDCDFWDWGTEVSLTDERTETLHDLSKYLLDFYPQYARGAHYIQQLCGQVSVRRKPLVKLTYILQGPPAPFQQGEAHLVDPEPHNVRKLRVKFHRYYWLRIRLENVSGERPCRRETCGWNARFTYPKLMQIGSVWQSSLMCLSSIAVFSLVCFR